MNEKLVIYETIIFMETINVTTHEIIFFCKIIFHNNENLKKLLK